MTNIIIVSWGVWEDGEKRFQAFKQANKKDPNYVTIAGAQIQLEDWKDSQNRVTQFKNSYKTNPSTVRLTIPSTIKVVETPKKNIIPVFHFNQQNVGRGFSEYCCGPVSALICASAYDLVNRDNFMVKAYGLIEIMKTMIGSGTTPGNLVDGFNKYFTTLKMETQSFTEENINENIENQIPMIFNAAMNKNFGYGSFKGGHYLAGTGYNGKVGISDPHGFNIGRGSRWDYNFKTLKEAIDNNGSRPIFRVIKK